MKSLFFKASLFGLIGLGVVISGCNNDNKPPQSGPVQGTLQLDNLSPEQQIEKVKNDPQIPEQYKQTFINSIRAKAAKGGAR